VCVGGGALLSVKCCKEIHARCLGNSVGAVCVGGGGRRGGGGLQLTSELCVCWVCVGWVGAGLAAADVTMSTDEGSLMCGS